VVIVLSDDARIADARIVCIAVGPRPIRMIAAEQILRGARELDESTAAELQHSVEDALQPTGQLRASAEYKRRVSGVLVRRAVIKAWGMASGTLDRP
jgi:carbon-monoxide dehydrogenase medium subunit